MTSAPGLVLLYLIVVSIAIALRAIYRERLDFIGMPWIIMLALVPLVPALIPIVSPWMRRFAPQLQSVKLGGLEVQLRQAEPQVASLGSVGATLTDPNVQPLRVAGQEDFNTTHAVEILKGMNAIHAKGAEVVIVDLEAGAKWRYPNLYFLARLLEAEPCVRLMVFTESRGGQGGYFVAMCAPHKLHTRFETAFPPYADAGKELSIPTDMSTPGLEVQLKGQFDAFREGLKQSEGSFTELQDLVGSPGLLKLLGTAANTTTIEAKETLSDDDYRTILLSPFRYTAATTRGQLRSVIDQVPLAVAFAKAALARD